MNKKNTASKFLAGVMLLSAVAPYAVMAEPETRTHKIEIRKLVEGDNFVYEDNKLTHTGKDQDKDLSTHNLSRYDAAKQGEITYHLYKLNYDKVQQVSKNQQLNQGNNSLVKELTKGTNPDKLLSEDQILTNLKTKGLVTNPNKADKSLVEINLTKDKAEATITYTTDEVKGGKSVYYLLIESKTPATLTQKTDPMIIELPTVTPEGEKLDTTIIYPKGKINEDAKKLVFTKVGSEDKTKALTGAKFKLYKEGETQPYPDDTLNFDTQTNTFTVKGLEVGKYYLAESEATSETEPNFRNKNGKTAIETSTKKPTYLFGTAETEAETGGRKLSFEFTKEGKIQIPDGSLIEKYDDKGVEKYRIKNDKAPTLKKKVEYDGKEVDKPTGEFGADTHFTHRITVDIPANIREYTKFKVIDTRTNLLLSQDHYQTTTVGIYEGNELFESLNDSGLYTVTYTGQHDNITTFDFNKFIEATKTGRFKDASFENKTLRITYTVQPHLYPENTTRNEVGVGISEVKNEAALDTAIGETPIKTPETPEENQIVKDNLYSVTFKKVDNGVFGTGVANTALGNAEFILQRKFGNTTEYRKSEIEWTTDKEKAMKYISNDTNGDTKGLIKITGLAKNKVVDGTDKPVQITYTLEEVKAPENYNLPAEVEDRKTTFVIDTKEDSGKIKGIIKKGKDGDEITDFNIENQKKADAPFTGLEKTVIASTATTGLIAVAGAVILINKRKEEKEATK